MPHFKPVNTGSYNLLLPPSRFVRLVEGPNFRPSLPTLTLSRPCHYDGSNALLGQNSTEQREVAKLLAWLPEEPKLFLSNPGLGIQKF